ncbi:putative fatty acyl-CoA reductase CG8306 [Cochliomyia hominivorax]
MITKFFENAEIFITGGSGVVGKALIEKLLRSCNVSKIYILLRPKKNLSIEERLEKIKKAMVFDQLKLQKPDELNQKLVPIPGDCLLPYLGITTEYAMILENVTMVFHSAATVRFDAPLRDALKLNVGGTLQALLFAETLKHLKVFIHISTFFSNPYLKRVEEKLYESPMDWRFCLNLVEKTDISEEQLNALTRKLIMGFPNTYCFTKNLSESLVNDYKDKLPVGIFRPSIVVFALEEPEPGFSPTLMGAMGLFALTQAGLMKTIFIGDNTRLDFTPQDIGTKTLCYFTYKTTNLYEKTPKVDKIPVYNMSSCTHNDIKFTQYIKIMEDYNFWTKVAAEKSLLIPSIYPTESRAVYWILLIFKSLLPSILVDFLLMLWGRKPILMGIQRKLFISLEVMKPFLFNNYESGGITDYQELLHMLEGTEFNIDIVAAKGDEFFKNVGYCYSMAHSIRKHLLKEDPKTLPRSRRILQIKIWFYNFIKFVLFVKLFEKLLDYFGFNHGGQMEN